MACQLCKKMGPVISDRHRSHRQCAFDEQGHFQESNYCCGTLMALRHFVDYSERYKKLKEGYDVTTIYADDTHLHTFTYPEEDDLLALMMRVYKSQGRTEGLWVISKQSSLVPRPPQQHEVERLLDHLCNLTAGSGSLHDAQLKTLLT